MSARVNVERARGRDFFRPRPPARRPAVPLVTAPPPVCEACRAPAARWGYEIVRGAVQWRCRHHRADVEAEIAAVIARRIGRAAG